MSSSDSKSIEERMEPPQFAYLPPPGESLQMYKQEGLKEKLIRKTKENPAVPFGIALTTFALSYGMWQMKTGNTLKSQKMMRLRIFGQGFTIIAILGGVLYASQKKTHK